ncbi:Hypothetical protein A7982_02349 [Minicystis rosea]|nr:Hypothetical protein A7982_02349 [Minicystis rosea]
MRSLTPNCSASSAARNLRRAVSASAMAINRLSRFIRSSSYHDHRTSFALDAAGASPQRRAPVPSPSR